MADDELREIPVAFYRTAAGAEPVRDWLRRLSAEDRKTIGTDLATVQVGWPVGMPLCRSLGAGLWELRSKLSNGRIARLLFFVAGDRIGTEGIAPGTKTDDSPGGISSGPPTRGPAPARIPLLSNFR